MANEKLRYDRDNILAIPDLSVGRHYESEGIIPTIPPEPEVVETPDRYVETLDDLDSVYKLADLLPSDLATIIRDITDVLRRDTQGKIILQIERKGKKPEPKQPETPKEPTPEEPKPKKPASPPEYGPDVALTPVDDTRFSLGEIDDIFSRKPAVTIEVDRGRSLVDIAREAYKQDDSDINEHYTSMMTQLTNRFFQIMTTLAEESGMDEYTYLMQDFDGTAVTTDDPNQQHLIDSICKGQIIYDQKIRQMNLTHTAANTLCMTRGFHVAEMQRERYLQEQYKKDLKDMPSTFSNDLLEASRSEATKKYKQAAYNEFKYLDNAVKNTNALLNIKIDEASAKAQLSNTGSDIFAFTPPPAPTENQIDDNYDATQSAQQRAQSDINSAARDSVTGQQASSGGGSSYSGGGDYTPVSLKGNGVAEQVWNFLKDMGYDNNAAAGIMGNISVESAGYQVDVTENGGAPMTPGVGYGLCQWTVAERQERLSAAAQRTGKPVSSLETQLSCLKWELENRYASCLPSNLNGRTMEEATEKFMWEFEGPNASSTYIDRRLSEAQNAAGTFGGK